MDLICRLGLFIFQWKHSLLANLGKYEWSYLSLSVLEYLYFTFIFEREFYWKIINWQGFISYSILAIPLHYLLESIAFVKNSAVFLTSAPFCVMSFQYLYSDVSGCDTVHFTWGWFNFLDVKINVSSNFRQYFFPLLSFPSLRSDLSSLCPLFISFV